MPRDFPVSQLYSCVLEPPERPNRYMHAHDALELGVCHEGSGMLIVEDRVFPFTAGDTCFVNDREMHMSFGVGDAPSRWTFLWLDPGALLAGLPDVADAVNTAALNGRDLPSILNPRDHPVICGAIGQLINEVRDQHPGHRAAIRGLALLLMAQIHRILPNDQGNPTDRSEVVRSELDRIAPAIEFMAANFTDEVCVDDLAELCHMSLTHFRRVFGAAIGKPPLQYLAQLRVRTAAAMLQETDKSIASIAFDVGYAHINTFNRQFRQLLNLSPSEWRRQRAGLRST